MLKSSPATLQHKATSAQTDRRGPPSLLALLRPRFFGLAASFFLAFVVFWAVTYESPVPLPTQENLVPAVAAPSRDEQRPLEAANKVLYPAEITPKYHDEAMAGKASLRTVVVQALAGKDKNTATVIFAHGLGDTGHGWTFLAEQLRPRFPYIKFIFPHAPSIPITLNGGMRMPGWFDILFVVPICCFVKLIPYCRSERFAHRVQATRQAKKMRLVCSRVLARSKRL